MTSLKATTTISRVTEFEGIVGFIASVLVYRDDVPEFFTQIPWWVLAILFCLMWNYPILVYRDTDKKIKWLSGWASNKNTNI